MSRQTRYLGILIPDDALGLTTFDELRLILVSDSVYPTVRRLTSLDRSVLNSKLDEIREIRNAIGHNRHISPKTCRILDAAVLCLEEGIDHIRNTIGAGPESRGRYGESADSERVSQLEFIAARFPLETLSSDRISFRCDREFYYLGLVPRHLVMTPEHETSGITSGSDDNEGSTLGEVSALGEWIDLEELCGRLAEVRRSLIAIVVTFRGTSFELIWSRKAGNDAHEAILNAFVRSVENVWGDLELSEQSQALFFDEKIWLSAVP